MLSCILGADLVWQGWAFGPLGLACLLSRAARFQFQWGERQGPCLHIVSNTPLWNLLIGQNLFVLITLFGNSCRHGCLPDPAGLLCPLPSEAKGRWCHYSSYVGKHWKWKEEFLFPNSFCRHQFLHYFYSPLGWEGCVRGNVEAEFAFGGRFLPEGSIGEETDIKIQKLIYFVRSWPKQS